MSQKMKKAVPFVLLALILLNSLFSEILLLPVIGEDYTFLYTPLFWVALGGLSLLLLRRKHYRKRMKKDMIFWVVVAAIMYLVMRFSAGIFEGFGYSALDHSFFGIMRNLFAYVVPHICREIVRAALLMDCRSGKKRTKLLCVLSAIILAVSEMSSTRFLNGIGTPIGVFEQVGGYLMPALVVSAMLTYTAMSGGPLPGIIYRVSTLTLFYVLPIIPDSSWLTVSLLGSLIPFIITIIINYSIGITNHTMSRRDVNNEKPGEWIAVFAVLIAFILFITGVLPVYPVAVATGSMEPVIMTGDMVVVNKTDKAKEQLKVGDVIQFRRGNYTVIHRIIEISHDHEQMYYITKGDNNNAPDLGEVTPDMVIGRVEFHVPYAGWLTLWMHSQRVEEDTENVDVETGRK